MRGLVFVRLSFPVTMFGLTIVVVETLQNSSGESVCRIFPSGLAGSSLQGIQSRYLGHRDDERKRFRCLFSINEKVNN